MLIHKNTVITMFPHKLHKQAVAISASIILSLATLGSYAQTDSVRLLQLTNRGVVETIELDNNFDKLLQMWYIQQSTDSSNPFSIIETDSILPMDVPDSVYINRLQRINSFIELPYNPIIKRFISAYTHRSKEQVEVMLGLSDYYFPYFEEILIKNNLPIELRMLPVIESALNPRAVSRVGATGLWQFMYGTGRMYKLTINSFIDERRDPVKSTEAAAKFLGDLYSIYKDWTLVIAAYNCGPGNVNKAIRRAGGKRNFWEIYYHLPRETRGYVPAFIAATYTFHYYKEHNITPRPITTPKATDTLNINRMLHFQQVSDIIGIPVQQLRDLNPQYKQDIVPGKFTTHQLRLPLDYVGTFIDREKEIYAYKDSVFFNPKTTTAPTTYNSSYQHYVPSGSVKYIYKVKEGDVPGTIANRYGVKVEQLRDWNNIYRNIIRIGQNLTIYIPKEKAKELGIKGETTK